MSWEELVQTLDLEGITACEAEKMIRGYQMIEAIMAGVEKISKDTDSD
jgi:hypothetical protein